MAGKTRPSLMKKTLSNVIQSNLSITDKKCIGEVFTKFEELTKADVAEVVRCKNCRYSVEVIGKHPLFDISGYACSVLMADGLKPEDFCSYGERRDT